MGGQDRGVSGSKGMNEEEGSTRGRLVKNPFFKGRIISPRLGIILF